MNMKKKNDDFFILFFFSFILIPVITKTVGLTRGFCHGERGEYVPTLSPLRGRS